MKNKKGFIIAGILALILVLIVAILLIPRDNKEESVQNEEQTVTQQSVEKPTFMYFVTNKDLEEKKVQKALEKLKNAYGDRVIFDIKNVDEDTALLDNFPVKDKTPALIMLDGDNDISNIMLKTSDYDKLKTVIDSAFRK